MKDNTINSKYTFNDEKYLNVHSMRLFPTNLGAHSYRITGIASRCDHVILSDRRKPHIYVHRNVNTKYPRHIFLSLRSPYIALQYFAEKILPTIKTKFILISGSQDITIPNQTDHRFRKFDESEALYIDKILKSPYLSHWFCENLDDNSHPLISPLPTGMVFKDKYPIQGISIPNLKAFNEKPMKILCAHRIRKGPQWEARRRVTQLALSEWSQWCTVINDPVSEEHFIELVREHAFVLCVEGGGLDPSPKAWQTILNGSIPILRDTALRHAYKDLPVVFVPDWESNSISDVKLQEWYEKFSNLYADETFRRSVIMKLGIDYWWNKILKYDDQSVKRPISIVLRITQYFKNILYKNILYAVYKLAKYIINGLSRYFKT